ncbi:thioesterase domain-containing protein [Saccharothrix variisporea]|uniref:Thioesterase domain-containing protein n=1 Tax=Saccharothrix variisporea TaxID=543527 RepID=A0A495XNX2_9PSEU|nr:thioesterase domain-containing protein [Saccharothrix variisporea]RKT74163.1 thioesterase domain-containing protein [Saccharothrix variisporea]
MTARRSDRPLVREFPPTGGHPVVLVHPGAVPAAEYADLAGALAPASLAVVDLEQVPEYFEAALTGVLTTSVDALADRVVAELRARGVPDRWTLAGWSFGGVVAFTAVSRLSADERPDRVVLLDSLAPVPEYTANDDEELDLARVLGWFALYLAAKRDRPVDASDSLEAVLDAGLASGALRPGTTLPGLRKVFTTYVDGLRRNNSLARAHTPVPVDVPVTLVRPDRGLLTTPEPLGWDALAPGLTTTTCPGDHYSMLRHPGALAVLHAALVPLSR